MRAGYGASLTDEELLTRVFAGVMSDDLGLDHGSRLPRTYAEYAAGQEPIATLAAAIEEASSVSQVYYRRGASSVSITRWLRRCREQRTAGGLPDVAGLMVDVAQEAPSLSSS